MIPMILTIAENLTKVGADGFLMMTSDPHGNEYIGSSDQILEAATGFTGSNGLAVIGKTNGLLYTDGRYHLQAERELDDTFWALVKDRDEFFKEIAEKYKNLVYDPTFISNADLKEYKRLLSSTKLISNTNFINDVWLERPLRLFQPVIDLESLPLTDYVDSKIEKTIKIRSEILFGNENVTGTKRSDKLALLKKEMGENEALVITALDEIAWILNLRGRDIPYNPVFYSYLIITKEETILYSGVPVNITGISFKSYDDFIKDLNNIQQKIVKLSPGCNSLVYHTLESGKNQLSVNQEIANKKARKNEMEILGFKIAHLYDAIALVKLFETLENKIVTEKQCITEHDVDTILTELKSSFSAFEGPSFATISAYGENGAMIHHKGSMRQIGTKNLLLIDSGSQYILGTTDITRTICLGEPSLEQKKDFTAVLKGQIAGITQKFRPEYPSSYLDAIVRAPIWNHSQDYAHATGHGVGHFLNVHEAPPYVGRANEKFQENMIFSIEPGIYRKNSYGIRIEDLVLSENSGSDWLSFQNLSLTPLQLKMIDDRELNWKEKDYINKFNFRALSILKDFIFEGELGYRFLIENTKQI